MINKFQNLSLSVVLVTEMIAPNNSARSIGAVFDSVLSMEQQVGQTCKGAWYHLTYIGRIRPYLDTESAERLVHTFVSFKLDIFNSLLYGIPKLQFDRLQHVQKGSSPYNDSMKFEESLVFG